MRSMPRRMALPALLLSLSVVSGCGDRVPPQPIFPARADLEVEAKPVAPPEIVTDDKAAAGYSAAIEAWGERGWLTVARICRWAKWNGMAINC